MIRMNSAWAPLAIGILTALSGVGSGWAEEAKSTQPAKEAASKTAEADTAVYALVNGKPIMRKEFHSLFSNQLRQKMYHGQATKERLDALRTEVFDTMIERILLLEEAQRRGLVPDAERVAKIVAEYDARYAGRPMWLENRDTLLPALKKELAEQTLLEQVERAIRKIPEATEEEARKFYEARKDLFTEPEKMRLHSILLKVDPSSPRAVWDAAHEEAKGIVKRLRAGASFEDEARIKSNDESGERGGDMGYMHMGTLPEALQNIIKEYKIGEIPEPLEVLQGVGVFRLDERLPATLRTYDEVKTRAKELLNRDNSDKAWADARARLKQAATIKIVDEIRFIGVVPAARDQGAPTAPLPATPATPPSK